MVVADVFLCGNSRQHIMVGTDRQSEIGAGGWSDPNQPSSTQRSIGSDQVRKWLVQK
jgi:hypothetical protein